MTPTEQPPAQSPTGQTSGAPQSPAAPTGSPPATPATPPAEPVSGSPSGEQKPASEQKAPDAAPPAATTPPSDIVYDLKLPEKSTLDPAIVERTAATARALGLSPDAAQKVLELAHQEIASHVDALTKAHQPGGAEWKKIVDAWDAEIKADPRLGATPDERLANVQKGQQVISRYYEKHPEDAAAFKEFLEDSKLGSHPAFARFSVWLGKAAGEGDIASGAPAGEKPKTAIEALWGADGGRAAQAERDARKRERDHATR